MNRDLLVNVKLENKKLTLSGEVVGCLYYRIDPKNWSRLSLFRLIAKLIFNWSPVVIRLSDSTYCQIECYEDMLSRFKTYGDIEDFIDEME